MYHTPTLIVSKSTADWIAKNAAEPNIFSATFYNKWPHDCAAYIEPTDLDNIEERLLNALESILDLPLPLTGVQYKRSRQFIKQWMDGSYTYTITLPACDERQLEKLQAFFMRKSSGSEKGPTILRACEDMARPSSMAAAAAAAPMVTPVETSNCILPCDPSTGFPREETVRTAYGYFTPGALEAILQTAKNQLTGIDPNDVMAILQRMNVMVSTQQPLPAVLSHLMNRQTVNIGGTPTIQGEDKRHIKGQFVSVNGFLVDDLRHGSERPINACLGVNASTLATTAPISFFVINTWAPPMDNRTLPLSRYFFDQNEALNINRYQNFMNEMAENIVGMAVTKYEQQGKTGRIIIPAIGMKAFLSQLMSTERKQATQAFADAFGRALRKYKTQLAGANIILPPQIGSSASPILPEHYGDLSGLTICHTSVMVPSQVQQNDIYVNAWDPYSTLGNGCDHDQSIDGYFGRATTIAALHWSLSSLHDRHPDLFFNTVTHLSRQLLQACITPVVPSAMAASPIAVSEHTAHAIALRPAEPHSDCHYIILSGDLSGFNSLFPGEIDEMSIKVILADNGIDVYSIEKISGTTPTYRVGIQDEAQTKTCLTLVNDILGCRAEMCSATSMSAPARRGVSVYRCDLTQYLNGRDPEFSKQITRSSEDISTPPPAIVVPFLPGFVIVGGRGLNSAIKRNCSSMASLINNVIIDVNKVGKRDAGSVQITSQEVLGKMQHSINVTIPTSPNLIELKAAYRGAFKAAIDNRLLHVITPLLGLGASAGNVSDGIAALEAVTMEFPTLKVTVVVLNPTHALEIKQIQSNWDEDSVRCPISQEPIVHPVITPNGIIYEKATILEWLNKHTTDPMTNELLQKTDLKDFINPHFKRAAQEVRTSDGLGSSAAVPPVAMDPVPRPAVVANGVGHPLPGYGVLLGAVRNLGALYNRASTMSPEFALRWPQASGALDGMAQIDRLRMALAIVMESSTVIGRIQLLSEGQSRYRVTFTERLHAEACIEKIRSLGCSADMLLPPIAGGSSTFFRDPSLPSGSAARMDGFSPA